MDGEQVQRYSTGAIAQLEGSSVPVCDRIVRVAPGTMDQERSNVNRSGYGLMSLANNGQQGTVSTHDDGFELVTRKGSSHKQVPPAGCSLMRPDQLPRSHMRTREGFTVSRTAEGELKRSNGLSKPVASQEGLGCFMPRGSSLSTNVRSPLRNNCLPPPISGVKGSAGMHAVEARRRIDNRARKVEAVEASMVYSTSDKELTQPVNEEVPPVPAMVSYDVRSVDARHNAVRFPSGIVGKPVTEGLVGSRWEVRSSDGTNAIFSREYIDDGKGGGHGDGHSHYPHVIGQRSYAAVVKDPNCRGDIEVDGDNSVTHRVDARISPDLTSREWASSRQGRKRQEVYKEARDRVELNHRSDPMSRPGNYVKNNIVLQNPSPISHRSSVMYELDADSVKFEMSNADNTCSVETLESNSSLALEQERRYVRAWCDAHRFNVPNLKRNGGYSDNEFCDLVAYWLYDELALGHGLLHRQLIDRWDEYERKGHRAWQFFGSMHPITHKFLYGDMAWVIDCPPWSEDHKDAVKKRVDILRSSQASNARLQDSKRVLEGKTSRGDLSGSRGSSSTRSHQCLGQEQDVQIFLGRPQGGAQEFDHASTVKLDDWSGQQLHQTAGLTVNTQLSYGGASNSSVDPSATCIAYTRPQRLEVADDSRSLDKTQYIAPSQAGTNMNYTVVIEQDVKGRDLVKCCDFPSRMSCSAIQEWVSQFRRYKEYKRGHYAGPVTCHNATLDQSLHPFYWVGQAQSTILAPMWESCREDMGLKVWSNACEYTDEDFISKIMSVVSFTFGDDRLVYVEQAIYILEVILRVVY
jgi:hypothetical protein